MAFRLLYLIFRQLIGLVRAVGFNDAVYLVDAPRELIPVQCRQGGLQAESMRMAILSQWRSGRGRAGYSPDGSAPSTPTGDRDLAGGGRLGDGFSGPADEGGHR